MERILLSIKPKYVEKILAGEKIYELRRVIPNENIDIIFIYSSNPIKKIVGYASIDCILELPLDELWEKVKDGCCVSKEEFDKYFNDKKIGYAYKLRWVNKYKNDYDLTYANIKKAPENFIYVNCYWSFLFGFTCSRRKTKKEIEIEKKEKERLLKEEIISREELRKVIEKENAENLIKETKEMVDEAFEYLSKNTKNFVLKPNSREEVVACLLRAFDKYGDTWNPKNAIHLWLNLYNGHYLINGNKRLAFWFYNLAIQYYQYEDNFDWDGVYKELENE